jgi:hypothetical protein
VRRGDTHRLRAPVPPEVPEYRRYIGHPGLYDRVGALHFALIEPNDWLVSAAIEHELGPGRLQAKRPVFSRDEEFRLSAFGVRFDCILAIAIFSYASQAWIRRALGEAAVCLADDGKLVHHAASVRLRSLS